MYTSLKQIPKYQESLELLENNSYEEAYEMISSILDEIPNLSKKVKNDIYYARATLDLSRLNKHFEQTIADFEYLVNAKSKYIKDASASVALLYEDIGNFGETIYYGEIAIKYDSFLRNRVYYALARAYHYSGEMRNFEKSLKYIDLCIANLSNEDEDLLNENSERISIMSSLNRFDEAKEEINKFLIKYGTNKNYYQLCSDYYIKKYFYDKSDTSLLDKAIDNAKIALQYDEEDELAYFTIINAYQLKNDYANALKYLEKVTQDDSIVIEKIKMYEELGEYQKGLEEIDKALEKRPMWRLYYAKGVFKNHLNEKEEARKYFMEAYHKCDEDKTGILYEIVEFNRLMNEDEKTYIFLKEEVYKEENGILYYLLGSAALRIGAKYQEVIKCFEKAYRLHAIYYIEYLDSVCDYIENDKYINKEIKLYKKVKFRNLPYSSKRKMAIRYLYGENGIKQNLSKALKMLIDCQNESPNDSCDNALLGRCYELLNQNDLAYEQYLKGYNLIKDNCKPHCDCAYGYYAHALINGIGVEKDEELAKQIILDAISKSNKHTTSHVVFYYCYFALQNGERFNKKTALELLSFDYPFYIYDISRIVYLRQVAKSLNMQSEKLNELEKNLNTKYSKNELKYYTENMNTGVPLPYWKNI